MKLTNDITYVGMMNPCMRNFDIIMHTEFGTTYNSYLIKGEKNVLVETVHNTYTKEYIEEIKKHISIKDISYVILNHTEPDHSGSLSKILEINPDIEVIGTNAALKNLVNIMNKEFKSIVVKQGDVINIGKGQDLEFILAPNLHWPDSMFTYYAKENVLFSCDMFGAHYCEQFILDSQIKKPKNYYVERKNYYDSIFSPFKKFVLDGISKIEDKKIDLICNSHGPVLKDTIDEAIELYKEWSNITEKEKEVAIFYVSAYGYTRELAKTMEETIIENNVKVKSYDMLCYDVDELAAIMNEAPAVMFGSPTINSDALEPIWELINKTIVPMVKGKKALVFGSYGWSGEACQFLEDRLKALRYKVFQEQLKVQFKPSKEDLEKAKRIAKEFINQL